MKKKTISAIVLAFDICMVLAIVVLLVKIGGRGPKPEAAPIEPAVSEEEIMTTDISAQIEKEGEESKSGEKNLVARPSADSSVNVRSGPGTEYQRIGSAYSDCEYVVLEIGDEWVKIQYDENNIGYINTEYVEYQYRTSFEDGTSSYNDVPDEDLMKYYNGNGENVPKASSEDGSEETITDDVTEDNN